MGGILFGTMPILMVLLAPIFLAEETFTRRRLAGGVVGLAGIILLIGPSVLANASTQILGIAITFLGPSQVGYRRMGWRSVYMYSEGDVREERRRLRDGRENRLDTGIRLSRSVPA